MRCAAILALVALKCAASPAETIPLVGMPFTPGDIPVEWRATNSLRVLWVYKVVPQNLSSAVIFNAMVAGSFKSLDMVATGDKDLLRFQDHKQEDRVTRTLEIVPSSGWIHYSDSADPRNVEDSIRGVPELEQAERLGMDLLFQLGIDRTQLVPGPHLTGTMTISKVAPSGEESLIGIQARHVCFIRQIDGIPFRGNGMNGGFWIDFGSDARIRQYELVWRNLMPYELRRTATDAQMLDFIKQGKTCHSPDDNIAGAKKFTVKTVTPQYFGAPGSKSEDFVYPVASMRVEVELETNSVEIELVSHVLLNNGRIKDKLREARVPTTK